MEHAVPLAVEVGLSENLPGLLADLVRERPGFPLYRRPDGAGWRDVSAAEFSAQVTALAKGLVAAGVGVGDRVALMARTRYEWSLVDFAVWAAGAVPVPVYETSSADQARWILTDSGAVACVVETPAHARLLSAVAADTPALRHVWTIDDGDLDVLAASGAQVDDDALAQRSSAARLDDLATIIYTSGTTGRPKGCQLTHGNFVVLVRNAIAFAPEVFTGQDASTLLFLPLAHVFARFVEVLCVASPMTLGHTPDTKHLAEDLASFRPSFVLAVPRVFEKLLATAQQSAETAGRATVFARAVDVAQRWSAARDAGPVPFGLRAQHAVFDRLVYARLRAALGGRARYAVSGGAPLGAPLTHFFRGAGVEVLQGYGLTETTAPACVNPPGRVKVGTVGVPLPGCAVRIADDGEVLLTGPNVFTGYWGAPEASTAAFERQWFATGDLGALDADGYLSITGRKKEIIVTAGGKNVVPAVLEDQLRAHPLVGHVLVVGDQRPFIGALIALDPDVLPGWLHAHGRPELSLAQASADPVVREELQRAVDAANTAVSRAEAIRAFSVLDREVSEAAGHVTPSLKLRRTAVLRDFDADVEALYAR